MPFLRASAIIAVIFAFSPVREGAAPPTVVTESPEVSSPAESYAAPVRDSRGAAPGELERVDALWSAMPESARAELGRLVMDELRREISR